MTNEERVQQTEDKLLEMTTEMNKLIGFLPRLLDADYIDEELAQEIAPTLKAQSEYFKYIHEAGFESAGLISYYDYGLKWLEYVRLLEFNSRYNDSTMDIHECVTKIINLDIDITMLIHLTEVTE